ncbi:MAG TPA: serine/threonine-protein kinase [Ktedonobacterales bacterium]|nr:serine/threonine-protein kinase [Ktedonobacterales bacterium]
MADRVGQQIGHYRLLRLLGRGGFAEVYLGEHTHLSTQAAVKLLHAPLASAREIEQFRQEARTIAALIHPHIVRVLDFGLEEDMPYLVLDYAPGGSLRQRHPTGTRVPLETVVAYVQQLGQALQYAHDQKVIHRDIKPQNLLLGRQGELLLSDFGISVVAESTSRSLAQGFAGSVAYSAPEQLQEHPRLASDQYALGVVIYEWLSGRLPYTGALGEVAAKHLLATPPSLCAQLPTLPPAVEEVVFTAMAKDPQDRFASAQAFVKAFEQASQAAPPVAAVTNQTFTPLEPTSPTPQLNTFPSQTEAVAMLAPAFPERQSRYEAVFPASDTPALPDSLANQQKEGIPARRSEKSTSQQPFRGRLTPAQILLLLGGIIALIGWFPPLTSADEGLLSALTNGHAPSLVWLEPLAVLLMLAAGAVATWQAKAMARVSLIAVVLQVAELVYGFIQLQVIIGYEMDVGFWLLVVGCVVGLAGSMLLLRQPTPQAQLPVPTRQV